MKRLALILIAVAFSACESSEVTIPMEAGLPGQLLAAASGACAEPAGYDIISLHPPQSSQSTAFALNDRGMVLVRTSRAYLWREESGFRAIPISATAINNAGVVVGSGGTWTAAEGYRPLPSIPGFGTVYARDINESGVIAGGIEGPAPPGAWPEPGPDTTILPAVWVDGAPRLLAFDADGGYVELHAASALNERGDVVAAVTTDFDIRMKYWPNGVDGGFPQVVMAGGRGGVNTGVDMNDSGYYVGTATNDEGGHLPMTPHGYVRSLNDLFWISRPGTGVQSRAAGINNQMVVVGVYAVNDPLDPVYSEFDPWLPMRWTVEGGIDPLPLPEGATTGWALAINELGHIIGQADDRAVMWRPVQNAERSLTVLEEILLALHQRGYVSDEELPSLQASLEAASQLLETGEPLPNHPMLGSVSNKVASLVRGGRLTAGEGDQVLQAVGCIVETLGTG